MSNLPYDPAPALGKPHCVAIPTIPISPGETQTRWFEDAVRAHDAPLKSYLRSSFPSLDAEDIAQESYLRAWLAHAADPIRSAKAFLFTIARRLALDTLRHNKRSPIIPLPDLSALDVMDNGKDAAETAALAEEIKLLADAIDTLPAACRQIIILRKIQNLPQREVAARLGLTEDAVEAQVYRGIRRLETFFIKRGLIKPWHAAPRNNP